jgi:Domain of unknown function (DUF222)/HNH endonuclease
MCSVELWPSPPGSEPDRALGDRSIADLERELCELAAHLAAATCRWLLLLAEFDQRGGWAEWGVKSCAHWLSWRCSFGLGAAREHVRVARRLRELPLLAEAFGSGELSYSKVRAITRVATAETEPQLVQLGLHATGAQLERLVRSYRGALAATQDAAERAHELRYLRWSWADDGSLLVQGRLPPDEGALLLTALGAAEQADQRTGEDEPVSARQADALVTIARSSLANAEVRGRGGDPCELVVHVDVDTLPADEIQARAEVADGPAISPETVRRLGCDAAVVRIVERDGRPLSVGRRTRTIPPALRRALRSRDDGCRFPGCTHRRFLHAHHIRHWARGGATTLENLVQLCSYHHRLVHEGGFRVEPAGDRAPRFRRPDGQLIPATPSCARVRGPALAHQHERCGLLVDDRTCMPRSAGDPLDYGIAVEGLLARVLTPT